MSERFAFQSGDSYITASSPHENRVVFKSMCFCARFRERDEKPSVSASQVNNLFTYLKIKKADNVRNVTPFSRDKKRSASKTNKHYDAPDKYSRVENGEHDSKILIQTVNFRTCALCVIPVKTGIQIAEYRHGFPPTRE